MRDLRRQALESGKTVSRKAQSKIPSRNSSAPQSRTNSRNASRHGSDEEEGNMSDSTNWSINSIDDMTAADIPEDPSESWKQEIGDRIEEIIDRKRSSIQGRENTLTAYNHILMLRYAYEELEGKTGEILTGLSKSVKSESSERESCLALRAIALTLLTVPSESSYDAIFQILKRVCSVSEFNTVKAAAIHALSAAAVYGGAADSEIEDIMDDLLAIVESDGNSVNAPDSGEVVIAACEAWGYLATMLDDIEEKTEVAMEAFVDQLESSDVHVQIAAGENIALVFEKSYTPRESDDEPAINEYDEDGFELDHSFVKRYEVYRQKHQLEHTLSELSKESSKRITKKDRKQLHITFSDILNTVEYPPRGPRYSKVIDDQTGERYGSRMLVRVGKVGVIKINKWWKLQRLQALRRILAGGFVVHYEYNEVVLESLPVIVMSRTH